MTSFADDVAALYPNLHRYAVRLLHDRGSAGDLVQQTVLHALSREHMYEPGSNLRAWLFTMLHNTYVNGVRRSARDLAVSVDPSDLASHSTLDESAYFRIMLRETNTALATLSREQRRTLLLAALDGEDYDQMAELEDVPIGTIRSRLSRARSALRSKLDDSSDMSDEERRLLGRWT